MVLAGDRLWQKMEEIFKDLQSIFGIVDITVIVGDNANVRDHDRILKQVMQLCC